MAWKDLEADIQEELGQVGLDDASLFKNNLFWTRPLVEHDKNNDRWYWKNVWYPKNKEKHQAKQRARYYAERSNPETLAKMRERKNRYERTKCRKGSVQHEKRMEWQRIRMAKLKADPEKWEAHRARRKLYDIKRRNGQKTTSST